MQGKDDTCAAGGIDTHHTNSVCCYYYCFSCRDDYHSTNGNGWKHHGNFSGSVCRVFSDLSGTGNDDLSVLSG